jgi:saccharopine dehydrogenase (NAD+, L-lysine-forming)
MSYLIYGAYGYTGTLIAREAVRQGHEPILAGRDRRRLEPLGAQLGLETHVVALDAPERLRAAVADVPAVLHCAGPYSATAAPMAAACLHAGTHYLDLTGEIPVLQGLAGRGATAEERGVLLLPAVGFDVVPSDCLARALSERCPDASTLEIALEGVGGVSKGTLKTAVEQMGAGGWVRRNGDLVAVPAGWSTRRVRFQDGERPVISIPGADLVTAAHSTAIPNVTVYLSLPRPVQQLVRLSRYVQGLLGWGPLQALLKRAIERWVPDPSVQDRERGRTAVWASVRAPDGTRRTARLQGPHAYTFTARAAVAAARRVVDGPPAVGFQTPATAFGADFVEGLEGVTVEIGTDSA